jgi:sec-independent protein translocase protein TatB
MFDIGWSELVVIGVVALIAIGPKELPGVLRAIGQWTGKIRRMAGEFQGQFQEAMREAEMSDVKKQVDQLTGTVKDYSNFDPLAEAQKQIDTALSDKPADKPAETASAVSTEMPPIQNPPIDVPPPEQIPQPSEKDFAPSEPKSAETPQESGGGKAA